MNREEAIRKWFGEKQPSTLEELKSVAAMEYRQVPTGGFTLNRKGKRVPVTRGVEYVTTKGAGKMPLQEWYSRIREVADKDLLEKIKAHCRKLAWLKTEQEVEEYSLGCLADGAYLHWEGFNKEEEAWFWM